jgi:hypothetical protein
MQITVNNKLLSEENSIYNTLDITHPTKTPVIIGLNPFIKYGDYRAKTLLSSTPVLQLTPLYPSEMVGDTSGTLRIIEYSTDRGYEMYEKILKDVGIRLRETEKPLTIAFQMDGPINESMGNEYTESMFEQIGNTSVPFLTELSRLSGSKNLQGNIDYMANMVKGATSPGTTHGGDKNLSSLINQALNMGGYVAGKGFGIASTVAGYLDSMLGDTAKNLLTGSKLDFPLNWGGSTYMPSYSIRVRLVNPAPHSDDYFIEYIYRPLAMLMALCMPMSTSNSTYSYPVSCAVECPGLFRIKAGAVQNIDIIKGIEGNEISFEQRVNTIDLNITFIDLYSSIMSNIDETHEDKQDPYRPTFKAYMQNLLCKVDLPNTYTEKDYASSYTDKGFPKMFEMDKKIYGQQGMLITPKYILNPNGSITVTYVTEYSSLPQADIDAINLENFKTFQTLNLNERKEVYELNKEAYLELEQRLNTNQPTEDIFADPNNAERIFLYNERFEYIQSGYYAAETSTTALQTKDGLTLAERQEQIRTKNDPHWANVISDPVEVYMNAAKSTREHIQSAIENNPGLRNTVFGLSRPI